LPRGILNHLLFKVEDAVLAGTHFGAEVFRFNSNFGTEVDETFTRHFGAEVTIGASDMAAGLSFGNSGVTSDTFSTAVFFSIRDFARSTLRTESLFSNKSSILFNIASSSLGTCPVADKTSLGRVFLAVLL
jgi:hypothetical protein